MATIRTFIGIRTATRVTNSVAKLIGRMDAVCDGYNWVVPENIHVTLNMAGDIPDVETHQLCKELDATIQPFSSFALSVHGVGGFPDTKQPRVLWMGVDEGTTALTAIHHAVADKLSEWGVNRERQTYLPHVTLGRLRKSGRWNDALLDLAHRTRNHDAGTCWIDTVTVFSSFLDRQGPTYTPMASIRLQ